MSDTPPNWVVDGPPDGAPASAPAAYRGNGNDPQPRRQVPVATGEDGAAFLAWLNSQKTKRDLGAMLPDYLPVEQFISVAKDAATSNPKLLAPNVRPSLLRAIGRAAKMGLRPDGREGALVPRYDAETRSYGIVWQPMVWGIIKLGRFTGAIESIRPVIVFIGETFEIEEGDEQIYRHKVDRAIVAEAYRALYGGMERDGNRERQLVQPNEFFDRVDCAYCIIRSRDGVVTKRWMPKDRIALIRNMQGKNTPWHGPFLDEMINKTTMLFTSKHLDLDITNPSTLRFRDAMDHDMQLDFDASKAIGAPVPGGVGRIGYETKLDAIERAGGRSKEKVRRAAPAKREASTAKNGVSAEAETGKAAQGASEGSQTDAAESLREQDRFKGGADDPGFDNGRDHPDASLSSTSNEGAKPEAKPRPPKTEAEVRGWYERTVKVVNAFTDEAAMDKQLAGSITAKWIECINGWYPDVATDFRMLVEDRRSFIRQIPKK